MLKISNWEIYKTAGENGWCRGRPVGKDLQKAPFFVFKSQEPLELSCFSDCYPLTLYPLSKVIVLSRIEVHILQNPFLAGPLFYSQLPRPPQQSFSHNWIMERSLTGR